VERGAGKEGAQRAQELMTCRPVHPPSRAGRDLSVFCVHVIISVIPSFLLVWALPFCTCLCLSQSKKKATFFSLLVVYLFFVSCQFVFLNFVLLCASFAQVFSLLLPDSNRVIYLCIIIYNVHILDDYVH
jgi:hypothetical protein